MSRNLGSFVTLSLNGQLRGCIGSILGREPLYQNIWHMAKQAAFSDPRFPPLTVSEWPQCAIEISVLDEPSLCPDPSLIEIGKHGLILQYRGRTGVFLPQVPVEQGWNLDQYLNHLCYKAQVPPGSHTKEGAQIFWFEAFVFPVAR
ncbi:MAG: AmmeMemoRadiSam system protein A [Desulfovibrio sp.]|nr:AmmeMemoRadiSam system protein A [Desulfovibrio sp.]